MERPYGTVSVGVSHSSTPPPICGGLRQKGGANSPSWLTQIWASLWQPTHYGRLDVTLHSETAFGYRKRLLVLMPRLPAHGFRHLQ